MGTLKSSLSSGLAKGQKAAEKQKRKGQQTAGGGKKSPAAYSAAPAKRHAEETETVKSESTPVYTAAKKSSSANAAVASSMHYSSSGSRHSGTHGSLDEVLDYGTAIGGGIESGLWRGSVTGPIHLGASAVANKISSNDTDTWFGKPAALKEKEITTAFLNRLGRIWEGYELGSGTFQQRVKDSAFAGYHSAFQDYLEGSGRMPGVLSGGIERDALYLGTNAFFYALKRYALPAVTGTDDSYYNAKWLTDNAYGVSDSLTEKVSSIDGLRYVDSQEFQRDLDASSPGVKLAGQVSRSIANMLPSIGLSLVTRSPDAGLLAMAASEGGNAAKEAFQAGATPEQAYYIGLEKGFVEFQTEQLFDALEVFGGGNLTPAMRELLGEYASTKIGRAFIKAGGMLGENVEEAASDWAGSGIERAVLGHTIDSREDQAVTQSLMGQAPWTEDGLVTLLTTMLLNGAGHVIGSAGTRPPKTVGEEGQVLAGRETTTGNSRISALMDTFREHAEMQKSMRDTYLRKLEEIGYLPAEDSNNAAHEGAAGKTHPGEKNTLIPSALQGQRSRSKIQKQAGALNPESDRAQTHALVYYESVRHMRTDANRIAKNTGFDVKDILEIKQFIFMDEHDLGENGIRRFFPSFEMAQSWQRLIDGKHIQSHDLTLLRHELLERQLILDGKSQDEAHAEASTVYNYAKESDEYYDKIKKHKKI